MPLVIESLILAQNFWEAKLATEVTIAEPSPGKYAVRSLRKHCFIRHCVMGGEVAKPAASQAKLALDS